jgi:DNA mismatch repair protein PMS2
MIFKYHLQAYALIAKGVRIVCTNQVGKSGRSTVIQTQGSGSVKDNVITVFGIKTAACLEPLELSAMDVGGQSVKVEGFVSKPGAGCGRYVLIISEGLGLPNCSCVP